LNCRLFLLMKNNILLGLVIAVVIAVLLSSTFMVSAVSVSYSDSYLSKKDSSISGQTSGKITEIKDMIDDKLVANREKVIKSKYPKVEIKTDKFLMFGGEPIIDLEIIDHTEYCTVDCYSILETTIHQKSKLMDKLETRSLVGNTFQYTNNIQTKIYVLKNVSHSVEIPKLVEQCKDIVLPIGSMSGVDGKLVSYQQSLVTHKICYFEDIGLKETIQEYNEEFVEYNNEELDIGTYIIKITGKKNFNDIIDWVPTIQNQKIEALAWWNITEPYGNGSLGDVNFVVTVGSRTFGNMVYNVDYTVGGNTIYLMTNRDYSFNSFNLGPGTTLATNNITGAVIYIMSKGEMNIQGTIDLSNKLQPGQYNSTSFSYLGDSSTTPSVANGGSSYASGSQGGGFGGGGKSGNVRIVGCTVKVAGTGGTGDYPFGPQGGPSSSVSTGDDCIETIIGAPGIKSGGGGGPSDAYDESAGHYGCTISSSGGSGGGSYGSNAGDGTSTATHTSSWDCYSGSVGNGGGGAGGTAGKPGLNLVIRGLNTSIIGTINLAGTNGGKGGKGGFNYYGTWVSSSWVTRTTGCGGYGGGGGGGANAGNMKIYYRYLTNTTSITSLVNKTGGVGGIGSTNSPYAPDCDVYTSNTGGSGSAGTITLSQEGFASTDLINPLNNSMAVIPPIVFFSATITPFGVTLANATFYLFENSTLNNTQITSLTGITTKTNLTWNRTAEEMSIGLWSWGVKTCYTDGIISKCYTTQNNTFTTFSVQFGNTSYNNITYEMYNETYSINITSTGFLNLTGTLVWDGTEYTATTSGNLVNATFTRNIWIPIGTGNKTFHWHILYGGQLKESSPKNVTVLNSIFALCNSTINLNKTFLNITYKDETTNAYINASIISSIWNYNMTNSPYGKQLVYSGPSGVTFVEHPFCFIPPHSSIIISSATYQYGNAGAGYSTKIWPFNNLALTNSSTGLTLYLINLVDSGVTPVTFQTVNSQTNVVVGNIRIQIYRTILGVSTLVDDGYTDTAGTISYYMSPITPYTIVTSGGGCNSLTSTITPTSSQYNLLLTCTSTTSQNFATILNGVSYQRTPADGVNTPGSINYSFYVISNITHMTRVKFMLIDAIDGTTLATNDSLTGVGNCGVHSCLLTMQYTTYTGDNVKGKYYVALNGTADSDLILIEADAYWRFIKINMTNSVNAIGRFAMNMQDFFNTWGTNNPECLGYTTEAVCTAVPECKWMDWTMWSPKESEIYGTTTDLCVAREDVNKSEFNRIVTIFFGLTIILFILGRTTGYELNHPGAFVIMITATIFLLSMYGMFTFEGLTSYPFFNQYIFALSSGCVGLGYVISVVRRYSG